jgi:hypothetical protein
LGGGGGILSSRHVYIFEIGKKSPFLTNMTYFKKKIFSLRSAINAVFGEIKPVCWESGSSSEKIPFCESVCK